MVQGFQTTLRAAVEAISDTKTTLRVAVEVIPAFPITLRAVVVVNPWAEVEVTLEEAMMALVEGPWGGETLVVALSWDEASLIDQFRS